MENLSGNLSSSKISLSYLGSFNDEITDKLTGISEYYLEHKSEIGQLKNKVSFLIAECFQNIVRHSDIVQNTQLIDHADFFQLTIFKDNIVLVSCNLIENKYVEDLEKKLIQINSLNSEELKKLYTELLKNGKFSEKGGAGIGLVEMGRKSGLPIKYKFEQVENGMSQFYLMLEIFHKKESGDSKLKIDEVIQVYKNFLKQKVLMFYKGDFSKELINPIVKMIKLNFQRTKSATVVTEKRVVFSLIESLENISKHGKTINGVKEGVLKISKTENNYVLEISNYIEEINKKKLSQTISEIKSLKVDEVIQLYQKRIMETNITQENNVGLGLLEIARKSNNNFDFTIVPKPENELFYTLKIVI